MPEHDSKLAKCLMECQLQAPLCIISQSPLHPVQTNFRRLLKLQNEFFFFFFSNRSVSWVFDDELGENISSIPILVNGKGGGGSFHRCDGTLYVVSRKTSEFLELLCHRNRMSPNWTRAVGTYFIMNLGEEEEE